MPTIHESNLLLMVPNWNQLRAMIYRFRAEHGRKGYLDLCAFIGVAASTLDNNLYRGFMPGWDRARKIYLYLLSRKPAAPIQTRLREPKPQLSYTRP